MLSENDKLFLERWERERGPESTFSRKLLAGLPMAALLTLPILLFVMMVYLFLPDWYAKVSNTSGATFVVVFIALLVAIVFIAYFRMHFRWEMNEQHYHELKAKLKNQPE